MYTLKNILFLPSSPVKIISCTDLAKELNNDDGTCFKTHWHHSDCAQDREMYSLTFSRPDSNLPRMVINKGISTFFTFCGFIQHLCPSIYDFRLDILCWVQKMP